MFGVQGLGVGARYRVYWVSTSPLLQKDKLRVFVVGGMLGRCKERAFDCQIWPLSFLCWPKVGGLP